MDPPAHSVRGGGRGERLGALLGGRLGRPAAGRRGARLCAAEPARLRAGAHLQQRQRVRRSPVHIWVHGAGVRVRGCCEAKGHIPKPLQGCGGHHHAGAVRHWCGHDAHRDALTVVRRALPHPSGGDAHQQLPHGERPCPERHSGTPLHAQGSGRGASVVRGEPVGGDLARIHEHLPHGADTSHQRYERHRAGIDSWDDDRPDPGRLAPRDGRTLPDRHHLPHLRQQLHLGAVHHAPGREVRLRRAWPAGLRASHGAAAAERGAAVQPCRVEEAARAARGGGRRCRGRGGRRAASRGGRAHRRRAEGGQGLRSPGRRGAPGRRHRRPDRGQQASGRELGAPPRGDRRGHGPERRRQVHRPPPAVGPAAVARRQRVAAGRPGGRHAGPGLAPGRPVRPPVEVGAAGVPPRPGGERPAVQVEGRPGATGAGASAGGVRAVPRQGVPGQAVGQAVGRGVPAGDARHRAGCQATGSLARRAHQRP
mmetsp:Transcript_53101/g.151446  ORF Transcript_53101/g.151446 Transcript_53101/m.151446 type:complete len:481 (+) Transcript_53101:146-1588(+)